MLAETESTHTVPAPVAALNVRLDVPLPREIEVGEGTALFACGTCFHRDAKVTGLSFLIDGDEQPVAAHGMPRLDDFQALHPDLDVYDTAGADVDPASPEDPRLHGYRIGFWGTIRIAPRPQGPFEVQIRARLDDGTTLTAPLATIAVTPPLATPVANPGQARPGAGPLVAVCMATYNPPMDLFRRQIDSIRAQTHTNWICIISDDCSSPRRFAAIERELAGDRRFIVSQSARRLGFYHNFERAMALTPADCDFVALSDQDDHWFPEKLAVLLDAVRGKQLGYSDVRVIDEAGGVISNTYWTKRRNNYSDLLSLLIANSVTGAASLFRRDVLDHALPFPPAQFGHFHDHWVALVALSRGEIAFVDRPLYDYVQHRDAVLGHHAANRMVTLRERLGSLYKDPRERVRLWRHHYFVDVSRLTQCATILQMRCGREMAPRKRRALQQFLRAEHSVPALLNLWRRGLRELLGTPETLGGEWMLAYAFTWRRLLAASARERPTRGLRLDALPPPDLWVKPGQQQGDGSSGRGVAQRIAPLKLARADGVPQRANLLIGTIDLADVSPSLINGLNLARALAEHGVRVRVVTVDPVRTLPGRWKREIEGYSGLAGVFGRIEATFARESRDLEVSADDRFIATTPWTAQVAACAARELNGVPFLYVIDEYAPLSAPSGSEAAIAEESYRFPHRSLFSSASLQGYFRRHRLGVYADGPGAGDSRSTSFQPAIADVAPPLAGAIASRRPRRLLFDGRPQDAGRANMFELGVAALQEALGQGTLSDWELRWLGTIDGEMSVGLTGGAKLDLVTAQDPDAYATLLRDHDVGLALAYTPQPSLTAIEMAAAGLITVTNGFENRTEAAMREISPNLLAPEPTVAAIAEALWIAVARAEDATARIEGSEVAWSRDWNAAFEGAVIDRVRKLLEP